MAQEFEKFAARKKYLNEKVAFESNFPNTNWEPRHLFENSAEGFTSGLGSGLARAGLSAIGKLISGTAGTLKEKLILDDRREQLVNSIAENDPIISVFERDEPGGAARAYSTLANVAPTLSLDPQVTTAFLRNAVQTGGALDFQTIKLLADAEYAIKRAKGQIGGRNDD